MNTRYIGNPLLDLAPLHYLKNKDQIRSSYSIGKEERVILLMPGSRRSEILYNYKRMIDGIDILKQNMPDQKIRTIIACKKPDLLWQMNLSPDIIIEEKDQYKAMAAADYAWVKSGTGTIEAMLFDLPVCVIYRTGLLNRIFSKLVLKTRYVSLPNLMLNREVVLELLMDPDDSKKLAGQTKGYFENKNNVQSLYRKDRESIISMLGTKKNVSKELADIVLKQMV